MNNVLIKFKTINKDKKYIIIEELLPILNDVEDIYEIEENELVYTTDEIQKKTNKKWILNYKDKFKLNSILFENIKLFNNTKIEYSVNIIEGERISWEEFQKIKKISKIDNFKNEIFKISENENQSIFETLVS